MTIDEISVYFETVGGFRKVAADPVSAHRLRVAAEMSPHYYGDIPPALEAAFPNESEEILNYRRSNYRAKTKTKLLSAIGEVYRLFMSSRFSIDIADRLREYIDDLDFDGEKMLSYFFGSVYPMRVIDPNAILLMTAEGAGVASPSSPVDIGSAIITSDRILNDWRRDGFLLYSPAATSSKKIVAYIVTADFYGEIHRDGASEVIVENYRHALGFVPFVVLGGRSVVRFVGGRACRVLESDFSHALPYLDDLAVVSNQAISVLLSSCFPIKLVTGVSCEPCRGRGSVPDDTGDALQSCKKCNGSGRTFFSSPLAGYYVTPPPVGATEDERRLSAMTPPIRYEGPPVDSVRVLNDERDKAEAAVDTALNIQRAVEMAQSGRAKEIDRERDYIAIGRIAEDFFAKLGEVLRIIQGLRFMDSSSPVVVNAPRSFDIKTEGGLLAEFVASMTDTPPGFRFSAYMDFIRRRFSTDKTAGRIAELAATYAPLYLMTNEEREALLLARTATRADTIKAAFVFSTLQAMTAEGFDIFGDAVGVFAEIDDRLAGRISPPAMPDEPPPSPNLLA